MSPVLSAATSQTVGTSERVVAIGDLNGSLEVLLRILHGLQLIDSKRRWKARHTHLIQVGDIFNRGGGAREALGLLMDLQQQAAAKHSRVSVLLGNHEVMTAMGNEAYCDEAEYLSFASKAERRSWPARVRKATSQLYAERDDQGRTAPLFPRLNAWKALNAPGQQAMRKQLGPRGKLGRVLRQLPIVVVDGDLAFVHGGITPHYARLGVEALNQAGVRAMCEGPALYSDLDKNNLLRSSTGPLWSRAYAKSNSAQTRAQLASSLRHLGVRRMVIGHTMTRAIDKGKDGAILLRHGGKLVCIDVGLGRSPDICAALVVHKGRGQEWTPSGFRRLWGR